MAAGLVAAALALGIIAGYAALVRQYRADLVRDGEIALTLYSEMTRGWLERYRTLAPIYARSPYVVDALRDPSTRLGALNRNLELWNAASGTAETYVMDAEGVTVAASNWSDPGSFVGRDFGFRPYFQEAAQGRLGRFFGLGTTSDARGYYFAAPVHGSGRLLGVVAVKVGVEDIEQDLRLSPHQVFITDAAGIVVLAGNPALRLTATETISSDDRRRIAAARQFDLDAIRPAPLVPRAKWLDATYDTVTAPADRAGQKTVEFVRLTRPMTAEDWTLNLLVDIAPIRARLWLASLVALALATAVGATAALVWQRRRRLVERLRDRERIQAALEQRVAERTRDLSETNLRLEAEIGERRAAEATLRQTQGELIQAGKLAALGQMSAALSHEFNQPLTAIRTYSENAIAFVEAGAGAKATENLGRVLRLTERMAQLSKHLTRFARRSQDTVLPVPLADALTEALELLEGRISRAGARVTVRGDPHVAVLGGQVRLQHVLMNLIGNAIDATPAGRSPEIVVGVRRDGDTVEIVVEDNGSGIAEDVLPRIFDPFFTTKEVGAGLGLGLSISFNIVSEFGGSMRAENRPEGGARVAVTLRAAETAPRAAAE